MRNILVLTDFSDNAYNALAYACELFRKEACHFYLLHSFEELVPRLTSRIDIGRTEQVIDELLSTTYKRLEMLKQTVVGDLKVAEHSIDTIASSHSLTRESNLLIADKRIDYVVTGTKGVTGARDIIMGSTAARVIRKIKGAPLLIIPEQVIFEPLQKITFTTGFHHPYHQKEFSAILDLPRADNAEIQILYIQETEKINPEQRIHLIQLKENLDSAINEVYWTPRQASKTEMILDFIFKEKSDMLAMIYYKHGFLKSLFRESVIKKIRSHSSIPFLMIPATT